MDHRYIEIEVGHWLHLSSYTFINEHVINNVLLKLEGFCNYGSINLTVILYSQILCLDRIHGSHFNKIDLLEPTIQEALYRTNFRPYSFDDWMDHSKTYGIEPVIFDAFKNDF